MSDQALSTWIAENHNPWVNFPSSLRDAFTKIYRGGDVSMDITGMNIKNAKMVESNGKKAIVYEVDVETVVSNDWTQQRVERIFSGHLVVTDEFVLDEGHEFRWV